MHLYVTNRLCVSVEAIDFLNPNRLEDGRECGVRLELRLIDPDTQPGSIYASRALPISRGVCRFDLLESAPGAQDRMHWHPVMPNGEGRKRLYDDDLSQDPIRWMHLQLNDVIHLLEVAGVPDPDRYVDDANALARMAGDIAADADAMLDRFRTRPWPRIRRRDRRGMALVG